MAELLLEVGCEELPAFGVRSAYEELCAKLVQLLDDQKIAHGDAFAMGTPRRLIVAIADVDLIQPDSELEHRGPPSSIAYDDQGNPSKALLGFCAKQNVDPSAVEVRDDYLWVTKQVEGRSTSEILAEQLPVVIPSLTWEKTMRWGSGKLRFARPLVWLLCSLDGQLVPFEIAGVQSGLKSRGHRFNHPDEFTATHLDELVKELRKRGVEPNPSEREKSILTQAAAVASGTPVTGVKLIEENVFLTEWPQVHEGEFLPEYLSLPESVLITAMVKHERFLPVRDSSGKLTNRFLSVRNGGEESKVRAGNEWVLNARFADAQFFYEEDKRRTLDDFLEETSRMQFHDELGSVRDRADRLERLTREIAITCGADDVWASQAGLFAKADLSSGLVNELSSLQGVIGGEYARLAGLSEEVCHAIATQYDLSHNLPAETPKQKLAVCLTIADQLDKLAGFLNIGYSVRGSSDPFALRRAATMLIEAAWGWLGQFPGYSSLMMFSLETYAAQGIHIQFDRVREKMTEIFESRYEVLLPDTRHDILDAALASRQPQVVLSPRSVATRVFVLSELASDFGFIQTATRPINLLNSLRDKDQLVVPLTEERAMLDSAEGVALAEAVDHAEQMMFGESQDPNLVDQMVKTLKSLEGPINKFFEATMVLVEDEDIRLQRVLLLLKVEKILLAAGDWSKIVMEDHKR